MPEGFWPDELSVKQVEAERLRRDKKNIRNQIIEECAVVAELWMDNNSDLDVRYVAQLAAAIRALKDKP